MNFRIRKVTAATGVITTFAGNGTLTATPDGLTPAASAFLVATYTAFDAAARVRKVDTFTGLVTTIAGGSNDNSENIPALKRADMQLYAPTGLAVPPSGEHLFISRTDRFRHRCCHIFRWHEQRGGRRFGLAVGPGSHAVTAFFAGNEMYTSAESQPLAQASSALACKVVYTVQKRWNVGFTGAFTIQNTGTTTINPWTLTYTYPGNQQMTQSWNATQTPVRPEPHVPGRRTFPKNLLAPSASSRLNYS